MRRCLSRAMEREQGRHQKDQQQKKLEKHRITHCPFRSWCPKCVAGRGRDFPHHTQEVDPDLSQDPDLGPKEDQLPGAEVAPNPGQSPDPSQEANPRIVLISEVAQDPGLSLDPNLEVNPRIVRISAEDLGQDLLEKNLDHDLPEINLDPDLLRREGDPGLVRINPGPDPTMASQSLDLVQSLRTHGKFTNKDL